MEYAIFLRRHIEEIMPLTDEQFEVVLEYFIPVTVAKKDYLIKAGQKVHTEYLVVKGCLKTSAYDDNDKEHIMQFAIENWWVSDYPAYYQHGNATMAVQALENTFVLALSAAHRQQLCDRLPIMYVFHGRKAMGGFVASQRRILSLLRNSAKEKYDLLLNQYPELFQRLPKKTIAHYLGVSRETLSRLGKTY